MSATVVDYGFPATADALQLGSISALSLHAYDADEMLTADKLTGNALNLEGVLLKYISFAGILEQLPRDTQSVNCSNMTMRMKEGSWNASTWRFLSALLAGVLHHRLHQDMGIWIMCADHTCTDLMVPGLLEEGEAQPKPCHEQRTITVEEGVAALALCREWCLLHYPFDEHLNAYLQAA